MITLFNDVSKLYDQPIQETVDGFICPVCNKKYKYKKSLTNHVNKQDCYTFVDLFQDTVSEEYMKECFDALVEEFKIKKKKQPMEQFRKSRYYKPIAKLLVYWSRNKCDLDLIVYYMLFCEKKIKYNSLVQMIYMATDDKYLREFRKFLYNNEEYINSESFVTANWDYLYRPSFMIRSLERADVGVNYLFKTIDVDQFIKGCSGAEYHRLETFLENIK